ALSATVISPLLGGWRAVMFFYGGLALLLALPWFFIRQPAQAGGQNAAPRLSMRQAFVHVLKIRNVWLLGITILGMSGCVQGVLGYLPLHLRNTGWSATSADSALATFHLLSLICTIPIAMISDRLGTRKWVMVVTTLMMLTGVSLLGVVSGPWVWAAVVLAGMVRDGYMAVLMTNVIEIKDVGVAYAGTATGMVMFFSGIGNLVSPPVGNSLAAVSPGAPFFFWAGLLGMGMLGLLATKRNA
ncbi:MAG: MFS transporter, partial [Anaerolineae bacterium]|nr:MFS transporter [Anaerolineae bacterium]